MAANQRHRLRHSQAACRDAAAGPPRRRRGPLEHLHSTGSSAHCGGLLITASLFWDDGLEALRRLSAWSGGPSAPWLDVVVIACGVRWRRRCQLAAVVREHIPQSRPWLIDGPQTGLNTRSLNARAVGTFADSPGRVWRYRRLDAADAADTADTADTAHASLLLEQIRRGGRIRTPRALPASTFQLVMLVIYIFS